LKIIVETILGILIFAGILGITGWFLFREQFLRLFNYFRSWSAQDEAREKEKQRIQQGVEEDRRQQLMREASARERAEAELEQHL
jgi:hypothetical protein